MDQQINKRYRLSPGTIEALQRIAAIDGDLSENQVVGRLIRNVDYEIHHRLKGDALAKYKSQSISREEYNAALVEHRAEHPVATS
jgi:hypothetical protein